MKVDIYNTDKKYNIIYADPPWEYKESGSGNRVVKAHYPTMSLKKLKEIPVKKISEEKSILFMWVTFPRLKLCIGHETIVVELLKNIFNDKDTISWWLYECNYGRDFSLGDLEVNGIEINLSTAEKLYDYLVDNMEV